MADKDISSANKAISIAGGGGKKPGLDAKSVLAGMTKDTKKRWIYVGLASVIIITAISTWMSSGRKAPKATKVVATGTVETTPKGMSTQKDWKAQTGAEMTVIRKQLEESQRSQKELAATMELMRKEIQAKGSASAQPPAPANNGINLSLPPPPEPPKTLATGAVQQQVQGFPSASADQAAAPTAAPSPPVEPKRTAARSFIPSVAEVVHDDTAATPEEMQVNDRRGYLPAGSFAKATLLSGVEAFTGGTAQSQPQPIVIRLDANAILPNAAAYDVKGCHVLASVWGDMSSERVFGRTATLTCVDSKNRLVLSEEVEGTLVDSDGKNGIRGTLQDRQGAKLARSLLAGFAEGMSTALGQAQTTVTTSALGGVTSSIDPSKMLKSSGYGGAGKAAEQLSEFYLKQAEATMPIIAVDTGRKISVLFTKSKALKFETIDTYRTTQKPKLQVVREFK